MSATEIFERRRHNLAKLIDHLIDSQRFKNGKDICEHFGLSASYITQLLNSKRQIGDKAARELERQLGLENLLLDQVLESQTELSPAQVSCALFQMHTVEQQAFRLSPLLGTIRKAPIILSASDYYAIQVNDQHYFPALKPGYWVVCDPGQEVQPQDMICLYLNNALQLMVELIAETENSFQFQSLDASRMVSFKKSDIEKMHRVVAILPAREIGVN